MSTTCNPQEKNFLLNTPLHFLLGLAPFVQLACRIGVCAESMPCFSSVEPLSFRWTVFTFNDWARFPRAREILINLTVIALHFHYPWAGTGAPTGKSYFKKLADTISVDRFVENAVLCHLSNICALNNTAFLHFKACFYLVDSTVPLSHPVVFFPRAMPSCRAQGSILC